MAFQLTWNFRIRYNVYKYGLELDDHVFLYFTHSAMGL